MFTALTSRGKMVVAASLAALCFALFETTFAADQEPGGTGKELRWPSSMGQIDCLDGDDEFRTRIQDQLGVRHPYTTACQVTDSIVMLLAERGFNHDSLARLDIRGTAGAVPIMRGFPIIEKLLKDKSGDLYIVGKAGVMDNGVFGYGLKLFSTKTWEATDLGGALSADVHAGCPEEGEEGYGRVLYASEETHDYKDYNGDGFDDIIFKLVETECDAHRRTKVHTRVFLATKNGFKEVPKPSAPSREQQAQPR